jgi:predicted transcriptional regulator
MSKENAKLSEDQLAEVNSIISQQRQLVAQLGDLTMQIDFINDKIEEVKSNIRAGQAEMSQVMDRIREEFGDVQIDTETGTLTKL